MPSDYILRYNGASNHSKDERQEHDFYSTDPSAMYDLLKHETFSHNVWEPACGMNHLSNVLRENGHNVRTSDIVDRVGDGSVEILDFLSCSEESYDGDIITNPPYKYALDFVKKSLSLVVEGHKVAMFLRLQFLEGMKRKVFFEEYPPKVVYVFSRRVKCYKDGDMENFEQKSSPTAYMWAVWEKGYKGDTIVKWI